MIPTHYDKRKSNHPKVYRDPPKIHLVARCGMQHAIGVGNYLPWNYRDGIDWVDQLTRDKTVVVGQSSVRFTLPFKHSDERIIIPLSTHADSMTHPNEECYTFNEFSNLFYYGDNRRHEATAVSAYPDEDFYIVGGAKLFKLFMPYASSVHMLKFEHTFANATQFFPKLNATEWDSRPISRMRTSLSGHACRTVDFYRINKPMPLPRALWFDGDSIIDPWSEALTEIEKTHVAEVCKRDPGFFAHLRTFGPPR